MTISSGSLETAQALVAAVLIGLSLVALPLAVRTAGLTLGPDRATRRWLLLLVAAAAIVRWLIAPHWMATAFVGYKLTEHAIALFPIAHYGVGASAFYHALFAFFPTDHATILWANSVLGVALVPLTGALAVRLLRDPRVGLLAAALVALTPLFVRNDNSDANNVPALVWLFGGLVLLAEHLRWGRLLELASAVPLLALAAIARPEMPILMGVLALGVLLVVPREPAAPRSVGRRAAALGVAVVIGALLVLPHALHVSNAVAALVQHEGLPGWQGAELSALPTTLTERNVLMRPEYFPAGIVALAALAVLLPAAGGHWRDGVLLVLGFLALAAYVVDLDEANMTRVQVPGALLATMLAAAGAARLGGLVPWRGTAALAIAIALATGWPTVGRLFAATNEQTEEELVRATLDALPDGDVTLVRLHEADRRSGTRESRLTHYHFPDYLFRPPVREVVLRSAQSFLDDPDFEVPAFFFYGIRCYAEFRDRGSSAPEGRDLHPLCAEMHERFRLDPVVAWDAPNRGDVWISYYGTAETLPVGLYRIYPKDGGPVADGP